MTGAMSEKLQPLLTVQEIDIQLEALRQKRDVWPAKIRDIESRRAQTAAVLDGLRQRRTELLAERDRLQLEVQEELERILTYERHIRELKNSREFQAIGREVSAAKRAKADAEEAAVATMEQIEAVEAEIATTEGLLASIDADLAAARSDFESIAASVDAESAGLVARRSDVLKSVDPTLAARYTTVRRRHSAVVVRAEAGRCTGCNRMLPPQLYNLVLRNTSLVVCPACQRLLLPPAAPAAASAGAASA